MEMERKAIALLSGGLDSTLAVKLILEQGIEVEAVNFVSPFCNCTPKKAGCEHQAKRVAEELGIPIRVLPKGMDYIKIVENPPHGYGRAMNPCIDCRIYMLKKVKELMPKLKASFVITGEVLGQRPMSQRRNQIALIEKESGLSGLIVRPLSAHHFPPSLPEEQGIVDRGKLLNLAGRSRKVQLQLAKEKGIKDFPCPAGGCLLTDAAIARRLRDLFQHIPDYTFQDLHLLKIGRHFRLNPHFKVILGRNQRENEKLFTLAGDTYILYQPTDFRGPAAVVRTTDNPDDKTIGEIIARYSQDNRESYRLRKRVKDEESVFIVYKKYPPDALEKFRLG